MTKPYPHIVDIHGLADLFSISERSLQRTWENYPKFFIETGRDAKSARFIVEDVLACLTDKHYTAAEKNAIQHQNRIGSMGNRLSKRDIGNTDKSAGSNDPFNLLLGIRDLPTVS